MKLQLLASVSSPQDLKAVIMEVRDYARWFSHTRIKQQTGAHAAAGDTPALSEAAVTLLRQRADQKGQLAQTALDELIADLEAFEQTAPTLSITLAAAPTAGLKKELTEWCRTNVDPNVLVQFQFNTTLLGGLVVRYGSRIFDWSFRRQILESRGHFTEVLRHV